MSVIFCFSALATLKPQAGITAAPGATIPAMAQPVSTHTNVLARTDYNDRFRDICPWNM